MLRPMCGLAGIFVRTPPGQPVPEIPDAWLDLLDASIAHRGPDGAGRLRDFVVHGDGSQARVALVHRRLSVLDLARGHQPMTLDEGTPRARAVVFNGCIYNHRHLREELARAGAKFATDHSDTEVLLHAHQAWGERMTAHLEGMYAFAIWNRADGSLLLARDLAGEKPLCYASLEHHDTRLVVFASGPGGVARVLARAVPQLLGKPFRLRAAHLDAWLRFGAGGVSAFDEIDELAPGTAALFAGGAPTFATLPAPTGTITPLDESSTATLLAQSVEARLDADVPIGCMLSGGIDSGLMAAFAQQSLARRGRQLRTFTVRMPAGLDESAHAEESARHLGTEHLTLDCQPEITESLTRLVREIGTPLADSSILPTYWLARAMRQHVTVALAGDGGDELFGGYDRHSAALWMRSLGPLARLAGIFHPSPTTRRADKLGRLCSAGRSHDYAELRAIFTRRQLARLAPDLNLPIGCGWPARPWDDDFSTYLPNDLLRKADGASMSVALELRAPLLDSTIVRRAQATPLAVLRAGGRPKGLLRQLASRLLPPSAHTRTKRGFAAPIGEWFRTDFGGLRTLLIDATAANDAFPESLLGVELDRSEIVRLRDAHLSGRKDHSQRLFLLLVLALWCRTVRDG